LVKLYKKTQRVQPKNNVFMRPQLVLIAQYFSNLFNFSTNISCLYSNFIHCAFDFLLEMSCDLDN
jgi:hypothetical protein